MTDEILELMGQGREAKNTNKQRYNEIHREIRRKLRQAKEVQLNKKCDEIKRLQKLHDSFNVHKKIKDITGDYKSKQSYILIDNNGNIIQDVEEKLSTWKEYIEELFQDDRNKELSKKTETANGLEITNEEVSYALKNMKSGKTVGPDELPVELLKLIN